MEKQYWFKPKKLGYGMYPCTWQGWLVTLILIGLIFLSAYMNGFFTTPEGELTRNQILRYVGSVLFLVILFLVRFKDKTEGGIRWNFPGKKKIDKDQEIL